MTAREFLSHLENVKPVRGGWTARCPGHDDKNPSLSICEKDGKTLLHCHAGCTPEAIIEALGLSMSDLFAEPKPNGHGGRERAIVATYDYLDENGSLLFEVVRFTGKQFRQRRPDGKGGWVWNLDGTRRVLYNLPAVLKAESVLIVEGERDVETARKLGIPATCNPHGAGKWQAEYSESLRGKRVAILCDADAPGLAHGCEVARSLTGAAESVRLIEALPQAKDLTAWIELGEGLDLPGAREQLLEIIKEASELTAESFKPKPGQGAQALDAAFNFVRRYMSLSEAQARAVVLWAAHTHTFDTAECTPYLAINSAEKECGKSRLLDVLSVICANPWRTARVSAAVLVRKIDAERPSLLLDESDAAFGSDPQYAEALRGLLNSGYQRGGCASLCVGQDAKISYKDFSTFNAKAIAGIGRLPDTVASRSIPIRLVRAKRGEVSQFRRRDAQAAKPVFDELAAWCAIVVDELRNAQPEIPKQLSDRQADCCEPLLAIADRAGGDWPEESRKALIQLCTEGQVDDDSKGARLLADIWEIFKQNAVGEMSSTELAQALAAIETSPWGEWSRGKPLSAARLARLLKPFSIFPDRIGDRDSRVRGYAISRFQDAFSRYLPVESVHLSTTLENSGDHDGLEVSTRLSVDTSNNPVSPNKNAGCGQVDTLKPGYVDTLKPGDGGEAVRKQLVQRVIAGVLE